MKTIYFYFKLRRITLNICRKIKLLPLAFFAILAAKNNSLWTKKHRFFAIFKGDMCGIVF
jgi:hypothetical protein